MKATVLLTLGLFLAFAPSPDSAAIAELSANFIVPENDSALQAAAIPGNKAANGAVSGQPGTALPPPDGAGSITSRR